jgi:SH3-like domain-containing protein
VGLWARAIALGVCLAMLGGCSKLRPRLSAQYVYVTAKQTFLRDRVAAVAERTGTVANGDRLQVLEHSRRYYRVKAEKGETGWIEEKAVATQTVYDGFQQLREEHKKDPAEATALVRDEVNMHLKPGRDTERFYRLGAGDKLQLLERATLPKPVSGAPTPAKVAKAPVKGAKGGRGAAPGGDAVAPPIAMEDWWLVRDAQGRTGWLLSRLMDVDAPESLTKYGEGQRFVAAYVLTTVHDDAVPVEGSEDRSGDEPVKGGHPKGAGTKGVGESAGKGPRVTRSEDVPIYLALMGPISSAGQPYDFDQVRVFTWSMKKHQYETAFRDKNVEGYLPVSIKMEKDPYGKTGAAQVAEPTFTYKVLAADAGVAAPDAVTGVVKPGRTLGKTYRLEGNLVRRVAAPGSKDEAEAHPVVEEKKTGKGKKK